MNTLTRLFERILTKAHHQIIQDDPRLYTEDLSHLLYFKDMEMRKVFIQISSSVSRFYLSKKLLTLIMAFDTIAFCMRFKPNNNRLSVNVKLIDDAMSELPKSTGTPVFLIGTTEKTNSYGWEAIEFLNSDSNCEIFPLIDFDDVSIYWAQKQSDRTYNYSQFYSYPLSSGDSSSVQFLRQVLSVSPEEANT